MKSLTAILLMPSAALASNLIFGSYPSNPECDACLDATVAGCPGDYQTPEYARCMCGGDGSANMISCIPSCNVPDNLGIAWGDNVATGWYTYCIMFDEFKSLCAEAEYYVSPELWADPDRCGNVDVSEDGTGNGGDAVDGDSNGGVNTDATDLLRPTGSGSGPKTTGAAETKPTATDGSSAGTTTGAGAAGRPTSSSAAGNVANALPTLGVMLGLGVQLVGMNL